MTLSKINVAGVVVLYNSSIEVVDNIASYSNQVNKLYIVDNSETPDDALLGLLSSFKNACYISNNDNLGIGYALNIAAHRALMDGYNFLLTMDDDSRAPSDLIEKMLIFLSNQEVGKIGIVSVNHSKKKFRISFVKVLYTMTSGSLLNLYAYKQVGPFNEKLFIDHVDHEYGIRLNSKGYKVIELRDIELKHSLGVKKQVKLMNVQYSFISHNPQRMYYMSRNGIYVATRYAIQYPQFLLTSIKLTIIEVVKAILLENQKKLRLEEILKGLRDGVTGRLGRKDKINN